MTSVVFDDDVLCSIFFRIFPILKHFFVWTIGHRFTVCEWQINRLSYVLRHDHRVGRHDRVTKKKKEVPPQILCVRVCSPRIYVYYYRICNIYIAFHKIHTEKESPSIMVVAVTTKSIGGKLSCQTFIRCSSLLINRRIFDKSSSTQSQLIFFFGQFFFLR